MYDSDEQTTTPAGPAPEKPGKSKALLVSVIANAVFIVGIVIVVLLYRNKLEKIEMKANNAVVNAQAELVHVYTVSDLRDKLEDKDIKLSDIDKKSYPLSFCRQKFSKGTSTRGDIEKILLKRTGPMPEAVEDGKKVKYVFSYSDRTVTIIMQYDDSGVLDEKIKCEVEEK